MGAYTVPLDSVLEGMGEGRLLHRLELGFWRKSSPVGDSGVGGSVDTSMEAESIIIFCSSLTVIPGGL